MQRAPIDRERLWSTVMSMAEIGALSRGGSRRLALSDEDRAARELFISWCRAAGCRVLIDPIGNIFAVRAGRTNDAPCILTGSHLDTQPHGGRFDGVAGVLSALEAIRTLNDHGIDTEVPVAAVNWTNEEGARFAPGLTGSAVFAGLLPLQAALDARCIDGPTVGTELRRIGQAGPDPAGALPIGAYFELHIEQGPVLERLGRPVGIVEGVQGVRWYAVHLIGEDRHAGTTPMEGRRDSFAAAARLSLAMREEACRAGPEVRFTVGRVQVEPGSPNTIPGRTEFSIDLRHPSDAVLTTIEQALHRLARDESILQGVQVRIERLMTVAPAVFDRACIDALTAAADRSGTPYLRMTSGAMHDASNIARIAPAAMIFIPCRDGVSHSEDEWIDPEHLASGCQLLTDTIVQMAGSAGSAGRA